MDRDAAASPFRFVLDEPTRILAVDDDPILREFAAVYLSTPTTSVETACDAADGLVRLKASSYDIALIDIDMPGMDGIEMIRLVRSDQAFSTLPIIVVTGREDILSIDRAYEAGATSFITKPVNWRLLSHQVRYVMRAHRALLLETVAPDAKAA